MEIEDAFTQEAIERYDTNIEGDPEETLRDIIARIYATNEIAAPSDDALNVAVLCFVAGRTYQSEVGTSITVEMTLPELREYSLYLLSRSRHD